MMECDILHKSKGVVYKARMLKPTMKIEHKSLFSENVLIIIDNADRRKQIDTFLKQGRKIRVTCSREQAHRNKSHRILSMKVTKSSSSTH